VTGINNLLHHYGYFALFFFVAIESLGVPLPGETALITAALYAGTTHRLTVAGVVIVAAAAAIIGDNIGFFIGDIGGYRLLRRYGHIIRLDEKKLKVGRYLFDRQGGKVVFFGRFVSVLRTYAAFLAGTLRMHWTHFLVANAAGGITWSCLYGIGAYELGSSAKHVSSIITYVGGGLAVVVIIAVVVLIRRYEKQLEATAEEAYPGPLEDPEGPSVFRRRKS
jgi:membrane protein DedA with SNARE-associated domain